MNKQNNSSQEFFPNNLNTLRKELNLDYSRRSRESG